MNKSWKKKKQIIWYLDSGASDHIINDINLFSRLIPLDKTIEIGVAKTGQALVATHIGEIECYCNVKSKIRICTIKEVLFVPDLRRNLLLAGRVEKVCFNIIMKNGKTLISYNGKTLIIGHKNSNLYEINLDIVEQDEQKNSYVADNASKKNGTHLWHRRYGHISNKYLKKLT